MAQPKPSTSRNTSIPVPESPIGDIIGSSDDESSFFRRQSQISRKLQKSRKPTQNSIRKNLLKRALDSPRSTQSSKRINNMDDSIFIKIESKVKNIDSDKNEEGQQGEANEDFLSVSQQNEFIINDPFADLNNAPKKTNTDLDKFEFTQYCDNTQYMNQIEELIGKITQLHKSQPLRNISNTIITNTNKSEKKQENFDLTINDALYAATCANVTKHEPFDTTFNDALCELFRSTQYKKEIEDGFDNIEKSICVMGQSKLADEFNFTMMNDQPKQSQMEAMLEKTFKSPEVMKKILQHANESVNLNKEQIEWTDESFANAVFQDGSITNMLRSALKDNLNKSIVNENVNEEKTAENDEFIKHGDFFGLPDRVKDLFKAYKGIDKLYDWQIECLNLPAISQRNNLIYALPTSGGKTLVAEVLILREILCRKKNAMFILPYVAIVQEKVWGMSPFAVALEFLVEEYAAGKGNYPPRQRRRKNCVYICTIEKALGVMNSLIETDRTDEIGLVVIDELHLLGDGSRGAVLETLLTKIKTFKCKIQMVGMSATIGNIAELSEFMNAEVYCNHFRPVELAEYVKCQNEIAIVNKHFTDPDEVLTHEKTVNYYKNNEHLNKIDPDHLGGLVMDVIPDASCLVFCKTRQNCENVANLLCKVINPDLKNHRALQKQHLKQALKEDAGTLCKVLANTLDFGVAYHHSGLTSEERRLIEEAFRQGIITVICCTSTLAAGVNLPAKRVIIRNPYIGREFINLSRYKQMVGRAGRAGFGEKGESIIICTPQELPRIRQLFLSPMDIALSSMHENNHDGLQNFLLSCISLKLATTKTDLQNMAKQTLLAVQAERLNVDVRLATRKAIKMLFKNGALKVKALNTQCIVNNNITAELESTLPTQSPSQRSTDGSHKQKTLVHVTNTTPLEISKLGSAAIKGGLDLARAHMLYKDLVTAQASLVLFTGLHLMYLVTPYAIAEQVKPSKSLYYSLYTTLNDREVQTAKVLGFNEAVAVKLLTNRRITEIDERVMNRFYVTLMLYDLWNEMSVYEVSVKYDVNRGIIQNLMTNAASFASNVFHFCGEFEDFWAFSLLLKGMSDRLSHCCVKELIPLMKLPSVKQNRAKQLFNAGYKTLQSVARAEPEKLMQELNFMSRTLANQLIAAAKMILLEKVENLREEAEEVLEGVNLGA